MKHRLTAPLVAIALGAAALAQDRPASTLQNGGFETIAAQPGQAIAGWTFSPRAVRSGYRPDLIVQDGNRVLRLGPPATASPDSSGALFQQLDATPWRGKRVRLVARIRVDRPGSSVTLGIRVARPMPFEVGFFDPMTDRALAAGPWREVALVGRVASDATLVTPAISFAGDADVTIDDVRFEEAPVDPRPPSRAAATYLRAALKALRQHMNATPANWLGIAADARADIRGAVTTADTYPAIRAALGALGDRHNQFGTAAMANATMAATDRPLPIARLVEGRFGLVDLPRLDTLRTADLGFARRYADTVRVALQAFDRRDVCGWIVDLRRNSGGNVWPMLDGLRPLALLPRGRRPSVDPVWDLRYPRFALRHARRPVAVLLGPVTGSAGEALALHVVGRPATRSFGAPTAGYTSANITIDLPDGAFMSFPVERMTARDGRPQVGPLLPDEPSDDAEAAAVAWLTRQGCAA